MDGTPKAKLRRQSLPSQHYLSPSGLQDETAENNERVRFRDEMGIDTVSSYANSQQAYNNPHMSDPTLFLHGHGKHQNSLNGSGRDNLPMKVEDQDTGISGMQGATMNGTSSGSGDAGAKKKVRKKWTIEETKMLVDGCNKHGVGNWKSMLDDTELKFDIDRTPVDLKDRFRTYFPEAYRHLYPNAKTHLSSANSNRAKRTELPDSLTIFEKSRSKKRRPFTKEEDEALREGFEKHGTVWAVIAKSPALASRRSTDLRDRFRNAFPDLYEKAGYKPRPTRPLKKKRGDDDGLPASFKSPEMNSGVDRSLPIHVSPDHLQSQEMLMDQKPILASTPEEDDDLAVAGLTAEESSNEFPKTPLMDTDDPDYEQSEDIKGFGQHDGGNNASLSLPPSSDSSNVPSRQRSPSNAQNTDRGEHFATQRQQQQQQQPQSPHQHPQQQLNQHQPMGDPSKLGNAAWYSQRWLSGTQGYGEHATESNTNGLFGSHAQFSHLDPGYGSNSGLGLNGLGPLTHGGLNGLDFEFGLSAGGWANQQTIIDRYDLPSSSSQLLMHSEAAIGDTGSSISGMDDYNANLQMSLSSHHRYAGDLFHGRGVGFGGNGGFLLGGTGPDGMPSFARAGIDLGALGHHPNASRSSSALGAGMGIAGINLASAAQSPEMAQALRQDLNNLEAIEHLEAVLGNSVLGSPSSVDPSKTLLHDGSTPPPGTPGPNSPPTRSFSSMGMYGTLPQSVNGPGASLVRHASMSGDRIGQDHGAQMEGRSYHHNHHQGQHQQQHHPHSHHPSGPSHSRSFSQPPSESRLQMGLSRSTTTTTSSPVKTPFQNIDGTGYGLTYDALINAGHSPMHQPNNFNSGEHGEGFSPVGTPNQSVHSLGPPQNQSPNRHSHAQLHHSHSLPEGHSAHSHHHSQQQRTPVQSHAQLHAFNSMHPPFTSPSLFGAPGSSMGSLSAAAVALDLHGYQTYQHPHGHPGGHHSMSTGSLGFSPGTTGMASYNQMMDQYLDFDTNALDLATAVTPSSSGASFASFSHPASSPQSQPSAPPEQKQQTHSHTPSSSSHLQPKHTFQSPNLPSHHSGDHQPPHFASLFNYGHQIHGTAVDDSMITQSVYSSQSHQNTGSGTIRRESFSYGTTGTAHPMSPSLMIPLNRVHSAGSTGGSSSWQSNGTNPSFSSSTNAANNTRDATMKARNPKRSSWTVLRSLAGSS